MEIMPDYFHKQMPDKDYSHIVYQRLFRSNHYPLIVGVREIVIWKL